MWTVGANKDVFSVVELITPRYHVIQHAGHLHLYLYLSVSVVKSAFFTLQLAFRVFMENQTDAKVPSFQKQIHTYFISWALPASK